MKWLPRPSLRTAAIIAAALVFYAATRSGKHTSLVGR
jgi:hypothetical protein